MVLPEDENYKKLGYLLGLTEELLDLVDTQASQLDDLRDTILQLKGRIEIYILEEETHQRVDYFGGLDDDEDEEGDEIDGFRVDYDDSWQEDPE